MLILECMAVGFPIPSLSWTHNGTIVPPCTAELLVNLVVCFESTTGSANVIILFAMERDIGIYSCRAESPAGVAVYQVFVTVEIPRS